MKSRISSYKIASRFYVTRPHRSNKKEITILSSFVVLLSIMVAAFSCSSESARYKEKVTQPRTKVRNSFSPKFDPIWIGRKDKAKKAKKEIDRLIAVMDEALKELGLYHPPEDMVPLHNIHKNLFMDCGSALLKIKEEANKEKPQGMVAVRIYQEMTEKILEAEEKGEQLSGNDQGDHPQGRDH